MSRAPANFQETFNALAVAVNLTPAKVAANADQRQKLLAVFNRAYQRGYGKRSWEDAWDGATVTPVNGLVDFSQLADARRFEIWSADPRVARNCAHEVGYTTTLQGAQLNCHASTVFVLSMPKCPQFTTTAWVNETTYGAGGKVLFTDGQNYQSLQTGNTGHSPAASPTWWKLVPVLEVLAEFTTAFARGTYLLENSQPQTGGAARTDALTDLDELAQAEYFRCATNAWRPKQ